VHLRAFRADARRQYELGATRWLEFLFAAPTFQDLLNRAVYLNKFGLAQFRAARSLRAERDVLEVQRQLLAQERQELLPLLESVQARVAALAADTAVAVAYDSELESTKREAMIQVAGLEAEGRRLQAAFDRYLAEQAGLALRNPGATYAKSCPPPAPAGSVRFCGHGWGHGVGLGQWGAYGMALADRSYREIDQHFYRNTAWRVLDTAHTPIHVAVLWGSGPDRVVPTGPAQVAFGTGRTYVAGAGQSITLTRQAGPARITPLDAATRLELYGPGGYYHRYRGSLIAQPSQGLLYVINVLSVEDYLRGLGEVPSSWPLEAIKAQIVAARSYALTHLGNNPLYDVDDTTQFQVYLGVDGESDAQNAAVDQTNGQALSYNGRVILAFFSASDGGHTANVSDIFGGSLDTHPYLTGVIDPWDIVAPRHTWYTGAYSFATLEQIYFRRADDAARFGRLKGLDLADRDQSNRLNTVGLVGSRGTKRIPVQEFMHDFNCSDCPWSALTGTDVLWNEMFGVTPSNSWPYW